MRIVPRFLLLLMLVLPLSVAGQEVEDAFSPHQGATQLVVATIGEAKQTVRVAAYSFTSLPIGDALIAAEKRGVDVKVVLDRKQNSKRSLLDYLRESGVPTRINGHYAIMHNKFMIIDGKVLELGSFNYTKAAEEKNAENVLVLRNEPQVISDYTRQWEKLWEEGEE
jgi:phosphatidylserine/phosphatidylglycerophosphate/cardiolipin synthase-like enzyme